MGYLIDIELMPGAFIARTQTPAASPVMVPARDHETPAPKLKAALAKASPTRSNRRSVAPPRIETETSLVPDAVAAAVLEEARVWLAEPLPLSWRRELAERANAIYAHNAPFRKRLRATGTSGRDWLWAFTRHWLAGLLYDHSPDLFDRLPASYKMGRPLPLEPSGRIPGSPPTGTLASCAG